MTNPELATPTLWLPDRSKSYVIFGFTGQGQQTPDMFMEWYGYSEQTDSLLTHFHEVTETKFGEPLDPNDLEKGPLMQPANIALGAIGFTALESFGIRPNETFGHSLGELGAVACAGYITASDAITLARRRGECTAMNIQQLVDNGVLTGMMAVSKKAGDVIDDIKEVLSELKIPPDQLQISNFNTSDQVVLSGLLRQIDQVQATLGSGTRSIKLRVDGAYHSLHMRLARNAYRPYVNHIGFMQPKSPKLYSPTNVQELKTRDDVANMLVNQLVGPVRYEELIAKRLDYLNRGGVSRLLRINGASEVLFVEVGAYPDGRMPSQGVLIGLNEKNVKKYQGDSMQIRSHRISRPSDLQVIA